MTLRFDVAIIDQGVGGAVTVGELSPFFFASWDMVLPICEVRCDSRIYIILRCMYDKKCVGVSSAFSTTSVFYEGIKRGVTPNGCLVYWPWRTFLLWPPIGSS